MRLDKFLCDMNIGTRSEVKALLKKGFVAVNGIPVKSADIKINETTDNITFQGKVLTYQKYFYYMLNKPAGYVSATNDNKEKTVMELFRSEDRRDDLFPAGRLDKDTTGLLLITNDGELSHKLLSPKSHVDKCYHVTIERSLSGNDIAALETGVDIGEDKPTLPAKVKTLDENNILLTIHEGKFHQVKRMLEAVNNKVIHLKRISFGSLVLDDTLQEGDYRVLTEKEIASLK